MSNSTNQRGKLSADETNFVSMPIALRRHFIQKSNEFKSGIWVEKEERRVNAKSLLGVLSLGIVQGTTITLIADGTDEKEAVDALADLIENQIGE